MGEAAGGGRKEDAHGSYSQVISKYIRCRFSLVHKCFCLHLFNISF